MIIPQLQQSFGQGFSLDYLISMHLLDSGKAEIIMGLGLLPRRTRDTLEQKAVKMKSEILMQAYKEMRNQVNSDNRMLKRKYFQNEITQQEGNVKGTRSVINKLINRRSKTTEIPFLNVENKICSEPIEKVEALNDFFYRNRGKSKQEIPGSKSIFTGFR